MTADPETIRTEIELSASTMALASVRHRLTWPRPYESWLYKSTRFDRLLAGMQCLSSWPKCLPGRHFRRDYGTLRQRREPPPSRSLPRRISNLIKALMKYGLD